MTALLERVLVEARRAVKKIESGALRQARWVRRKRDHSDRWIPSVQVLTGALNVVRILTSAIEAARELGLARVHEIASRERECLDLASIFYGSDLRPILRNLGDTLRPDSSNPPLPVVDQNVEMVANQLAAELARWLEVIPVEKIVSECGRRNQEDLGFRFSRTVESLRTFVRRNGAERDGRASLVGRLFAQGAVSVREAAGLLGVEVSDAIVMFERHGFKRRIDLVVLAPEERTEMLARIGHDRVSRIGAPTAIEDARIRRSVIATQRLEDVDARQWLPTR